MREYHSFLAFIYENIARRPGGLYDPDMGFINFGLDCFYLFFLLKYLVDNMVFMLALI